MRDENLCLLNKNNLNIILFHKFRALYVATLFM